MVKYRTSLHGSSSANIQAMEVLRETERQVVLPPRHEKGKEVRENKISDFQCWFDTWEQAHEFLVSEAQKKVDWLHVQLERANGNLGNIKGMKPNN